MGDVIKFGRRSRWGGPAHGRNSKKRGPAPKPPKPKLPGSIAFLLTSIGLVALAGPWWSVNKARAESSFTCQTVRATDGDTFKCDGQPIRMVGIDAPELPGHCRRGRDCTPGDPYASTENLRRLLLSGAVVCRKTDTDMYGRTVARCSAGDVDLSCQQIKSGFAVRRYSSIAC